MWNLDFLVVNAIVTRLWCEPPLPRYPLPLPTARAVGGRTGVDRWTGWRGATVTFDSFELLKVGRVLQLRNHTQRTIVLLGNGLRWQ